MDFTKMRHFLFFLLLGIVTIAFLTILKPFFYPLFWAAILAGVFYPFYKWLSSKTKSPSLSSVIILFAVFFIIIIPLGAVTALVANEAFELYSRASSNTGEINQFWSGFIDWIKHNQYARQLNINEAFITQKFSEFSQFITSFLLNSIKTLTQNSLIFGIMFFIMFYALFFFVRDGEKFLQQLMHLSPLGDRYEKVLYRKFISTVRATLKGSLIIGIIQGVLGGLMFAVAGISGSLIWGMLMALLATIPGIGSYFIWFPAALIMLFTGKVAIGVGMILFGAIVIGTIDNILRPLFVGKDSQLHPLLVLFSTLGGIAVFGISGFVIGPVIASLFLAFWEMYDEYYKKDLDRNV